MEKIKRSSTETERLEASKIISLLEKYGEASPVFLVNEMNADKLSKDDYRLISKYKQGKWESIDDFIADAQASNILSIEPQTGVSSGDISSNDIRADKTKSNKASKGVSRHDISPDDTLSEVKVVNNFYKMDIDVADQALALMDIYEQSIYFRLYRLSYGHGKNYCTIGYTTLAQACNIKSVNGLKGKINNLINDGWLKVVNWDRETGTTYRVYLPVENKFKSKTKIESIDNDISPHDISSDAISLDDTPHISPHDISPHDIPPLKTNASNGSGGGVSYHDISLHDTTIERSLKDLSLLVNMFYNVIGQSKISKQKRERAEKNIRELTEDGFSQEDIIFAINWTIKNAKEKPYDFALIKDTIGQAMAAKKRNINRKAKRN